MDNVRFVPYSVVETAYHDMLTEVYGPSVYVGPHEYETYRVLKEVDPIAYREGLYQFANDNKYITDADDVHHELETLAPVELIDAYIEHQYGGGSDYPEDYQTYDEWFKDNAEGVQEYEIIEAFNGERVYLVNAVSAEHALALHNANKSEYVTTDHGDTYDTEVRLA